MERVAISDGSGKWFDKNRVQQSWASNGNWNDFNVLKQELYLTACGTWVLQFVPTHTGEVTTYRVVNATDAAKWLIINSYVLPDALVEEAATFEV